MKKLNNTTTYLSTLTKKEIDMVRTHINAIQCMMKERAKERIENGKINEAEYREERTAQGLLCCLEEDLKILIK